MKMRDRIRLIWILPRLWKSLLRMWLWNRLLRS